MNPSMSGNDNSDELIQNSQDVFDSLLNLKLEKYVLRLYVANNSPKSMYAIQRITSLCEEYIQGHYELEVIDIYQRPDLLEEDRVFAIPTLIKKLPPPLQKLIGDMTNTEKVILCLDL